MREVLKLSDGLSLADKIKATFFKSPQQELCERYARATPELYEIHLRRWDGWLIDDGIQYIAEAYNRKKYPDFYCSKNGTDLAHGKGVSISDAFSDLLRHIVEYEDFSSKTIYIHNFRLLRERILQWENENRSSSS